MAKFENLPPPTRLIATRSFPSPTPEQIEYERRDFLAVETRAQRQELALREAIGVAQLGGHVEGQTETAYGGFGAHVARYERMELRGGHQIGLK